MQTAAPRTGRFPISSPPSTAATSPQPRHPGRASATASSPTAAAGALERVIHGVYRLIGYPAHPHGDMIAVTLWAGPDSAISHQSALAVYRLASAMPAAIHLTAPRSFQGRRAGVRIHDEELGDDDRRLSAEIRARSAAMRALSLGLSATLCRVRLAGLL